jgi:hypothetical protein
MQAIVLTSEFAAALHAAALIAAADEKHVREVGIIGHRTVAENSSRIGVGS